MPTEAQSSTAPEVYYPVLRQDGGTDKEVQPAAAVRATVCGVKKNVFWVLLVAGLVVVLGAVGGGVAGSMAGRKTGGRSGEICGYRDWLDSIADGCRLLRIWRAEPTRSRRRHRRSYHHHHHRRRRGGSSNEHCSSSRRLEFRRRQLGHRRGDFLPRPQREHPHGRMQRHDDPRHHVPVVTARTAAVRRAKCDSDCGHRLAGHPGPPRSIDPLPSVVVRGD